MSRIENHDARAWRMRAEECRALAETFQTPQTRAKMYLLADEYERLAEQADRLERDAAGERLESVGPEPRTPVRRDHHSG